MKPPASRKMTDPSRALTGFSLIELLVVIGIIAIMGAAAWPALRGMGNAGGVRGAVDIAAGVLLAGRVEAMREGRGARVVLQLADDPGSPGTALRRMAVFRKIGDDSGADFQTTDAGQTNYWKRAGRDVLLPANIFYLQEYSVAKGRMDAPFGGKGTTLQADYWEFDGAGRMADSDGRMVFAAGVPGTGGPTFPESFLAGRDGFKIASSGRAMFFQNPGQITKNPAP